VLPKEIQVTIRLYRASQSELPRQLESHAATIDKGSILGMGGGHAQTSAWGRRVSQWRLYSNPDIAQLNATETKFITVCFNTSASEVSIVSQCGTSVAEPFFQRLGVDGGRVLGSGCRARTQNWRYRGMPHQPL